MVAPIYKSSNVDNILIYYPILMKFVLTYMTCKIVHLIVFSTLFFSLRYFERFVLENWFDFA